MSRNKSNRFSPEVRERALRMVHELCGEYPSLSARIESIVPKIGFVPQTLNDCVKQHKIDTDARDCFRAYECEQMKVLEQENKELHSANKTLKLASVFSLMRSSTADSSLDRFH